MHSVEETIAAFKAVKDDPLSTVVIGVGPGNFADMSFINQRQNEGDRVHFVDTKLYSDKLLTEETLRLIPEQLVSFFSSKGIQPNTPLEIDDIVIEPFNEEEEGHHADIVVSEAGDISVEGVVDPPPQSASQRIRLPASLAAVGGKGKSMVLSQARRQFGRITKRMERNVNRMIDQSVNKAFGIPNVTQSARKRYHATNKGGKKK